MNQYRKPLDYKYAAHLEWEILREPQELNPLIDRGLLPDIVQGITVARDEDYEIISSAFGTGIIRTNNRGIQGLKAGEHTDGFTVIARCGTGGVVSLEGVFDLGYHSVGSTFEFPLLITKLNRRFYDESIKPDGWITLWFLNGDIEVVGLRNTNRISRGTTSRIRHHDGRKSDIDVPNYAESLSRDWFNVNAKSTRFLVSKVPEVFGPSWSSNLAIEFRSGEQGFADETIRFKIIEIASFLLGKRLVLVGETTYFQNGSVCKEIAYRPWGVSWLKSECRQPAFPPVKWEMLTPVDSLETFFALFTDAYFSVADIYDFSRALWYLWISGCTPLNTAYAAIMTAIELLTNAWVKTQPTTASLFIDGDQWDTVIKTPITEIQEALGEIEGREIIINKIKKCNEAVLGIRVERFATGCGFKLGDVERKVLKARNPIIHGGRIPEEKQLLVSDYLKAARTLFFKFMLSLLDYQGQFVDYSTYGFPSRDMTDPLGGPRGDGRIIDL